MACFDFDFQHMALDTLFSGLDEDEDGATQRSTKSPTGNDLRVGGPFFLSGISSTAASLPGSLSLRFEACPLLLQMLCRGNFSKLFLRAILNRWFHLDSQKWLCDGLVP